MEIEFSDLSVPHSGTVVLLVQEGRILGAHGAKLDARLGGRLTRAMDVAGFRGAGAETLSVLAVGEFERILLVGIGGAESSDHGAAEAAGGSLYAALSAGTQSAVVIAEPPATCVHAEDFASRIAFGALLKSYRFDRYRTRAKSDARLSKLTLATGTIDAARAAFVCHQAVASGVFFSRDLTTEPANILGPEEFAEVVRDRLVPLGVEVEILGEDELRKLGMGALLGVGQGSTRETQLAVMSYRGEPDAAQRGPVAFVGKGVTFDSGGISLKPAHGMEMMKRDMSGASAVAGAIMALALRKARVNAVGVIALVENMPDGNAQRPGDVVTSLSGQTIEVINTDSEGRLALADALWYTATRFRPRVMIDLATLTGAVVIALGDRYGGLYANDEPLAGLLLRAGRETGELVWRLPLDDAYGGEIVSDIADVKNRSDGHGPTDAGSAIAAVFLKRFVPDTAWAHLDIAGMAWEKKDQPTVPKGATGFGVRLLDRYVTIAWEA